MDGKAKALEVDGSTTTQEIFSNIAEKIDLKDKDHFALFETADTMG